MNVLFAQSIALFSMAGMSIFFFYLDRSDGDRFLRLTAQGFLLLALRWGGVLLAEVLKLSSLFRFGAEIIAVYGAVRIFEGSLAFAGVRLSRGWRIALFSFPAVTLAFLALGVSFELVDPARYLFAAMLLLASAIAYTGRRISVHSGRARSRSP